MLEKLAIFKPTNGKTHGMKFSINPENILKKKVVKKSIAEVLTIIKFLLIFKSIYIKYQALNLIFMLPQLDLVFFPSQIFWLFICFGLIFCYVNFYFFPRMQRMFEKREAKIISESKILDYNLQEIESIKKTHAQMILDAKKESEEAIKNAEEGTSHFIETKKIEIDDNFNKKFEEAKRELEKELAAFHQNIEEEILKSASQIIEKIENNKITLEDLKKLNDKS